MISALNEKKGHTSNNLTGRTKFLEIVYENRKNDDDNQTKLNLNSKHLQEKRNEMKITKKKITKTFSYRMTG